MMEPPQAPAKQQMGVILALVDGSEHSMRAMQSAVNLGKLYGSSLIALSVVTAPTFLPVGTAGSPPDLGAYYEQTTNEAKRAVENARALARTSGVSCRGEVLEGAKGTVETIVEFATKENVDLIVMGTRGLGGLKKLVLGSVSSGVVSHAPCSVLIVR